MCSSTDELQQAVEEGKSTLKRARAEGSQRLGRPMMVAQNSDDERDRDSNGVSLTSVTAQQPREVCAPEPANLMGTSVMTKQLADKMAKETKLESAALVVAEKEAAAMKDDSSETPRKYKGQSVAMMRINLAMRFTTDQAQLQAAVET